MAQSAQPARPEDALRISRPRAFAIRAKSYGPRPAELARPLRYVRNLRLVKRLRDEEYTMLAARRGRALIELAREVDRKQIPGAIVDCGVWNGGSTILMGIGAPEREIWAFDSFEGMPKPGPRDTGVHPDWEGEVRGSEDRLREGFAAYAGDPGRLHAVKGWFEQTFPQTGDAIGEIAILHVDADWYDSVELVLETFYERVVPGGAVVIDDYTTWPGAREATDEFRERRGVTAPLRAGHHWRK